jgi:hypothetical protein
MPIKSGGLVFRISVISDADSPTTNSGANTRNWESFPRKAPEKPVLAHAGSLLTVIPVWHCRLVNLRTGRTGRGGLYPSYPSPIQWHMPIHHKKSTTWPLPS